jgi:N-acetylglucosaminyldiphosphoundecaprenol N-acetyl-beta-D-mannosaminyltransferase
MAETVLAIERSVALGRPVTHLGANAANVIAAHDDSAYLADLSAADLVTADGQSVVWGARLYRIRIPERVTGIDLMESLLAVARTRGWGVYLLGARADIVAALADRLQADGICVSGYRDGYFSMEESAGVAAAVKESGATLLFVGMPSPEKERFIIHEARPAGIPVSVGVGGSFDVLAGDLRRAPRLLQKIGLEWLFRLLQEPRRLIRRYAITNVRFVVLLVAGAARRRPRIGPGR